MFFQNILKKPQKLKFTGLFFLGYFEILMPHEVIFVQIKNPLCFSTEGLKYCLFNYFPFGGVLPPPCGCLIPPVLLAAPGITAAGIASNFFLTAIKTSSDGSL